MGKTLTEKIISEHIVEGEYSAGEEIGLRIDQTLTQDATGTMAYLQFEALGIPRVRTELSVSYIDHNTLQTGFENADDHLFLQSVAAKYGVILSKAGNGICHQLHLENFAVPGKTLLGSDSHTPTAGGVGMVAIGAGGLDVAVAMGGGLFYLKTPKVVGVRLTGRLRDYVSAKDVILELLRRVGVKGGVGKVFEYYGDGIKTLSVPERATITNMGTETGATTSIFPSDEITREFLSVYGREDDWKPLSADKDATYDEEIEIDLSEVVPLVAKPHSPGNVVPVSELEGMEVHQVCIGSCTNSSYKDLMTVAAMLKGKKVDPNVSLVISPGSKQVLTELARNGALKILIEAGARILECACGPCIGMGQAPPTNGVSIRTFNRNFEGRSGTKTAKVYLVSPEVAAATAVEGVLTDPRKYGKAPKIETPKKLPRNDSLFVFPPKDGSKVNIIRGPNIKPIPRGKPLPEVLDGKVLIKVGDNVTTDHIMPAGAKILPLRSNIPAIAEHVFEQVDPEFPRRAKEWGGGFILGGENYGQGSSREHAALAPMYLGVKAVLAKSFARIHLANLVNFGIVPLIIDDKAYNNIAMGDRLEIPGIRSAVSTGKNVTVKNVTKQTSIEAGCPLSDRERKIVLAGGLLAYTKSRC
ncbi:MAG: aconitate hydratase [Methanobacteriota archaeon]|nr:MAG: aconitate hydratase [Euryarchaeota archaeon]